MKRTLILVLAISLIGLFSCKKHELINQISQVNKQSTQKTIEVKDPMLSKANREVIIFDENEINYIKCVVESNNKFRLDEQVKLLEDIRFKVLESKNKSSESQAGGESGMNPSKYDPDNYIKFKITEMHIPSNAAGCSFINIKDKTPYCFSAFSTIIFSFSDNVKEILVKNQYAKNCILNFYEKGTDGTFAPVGQPLSVKYSQKVKYSPSKLGSSLYIEPEKVESTNNINNKVELEFYFF